LGKYGRSSLLFIFLDDSYGQLGLATNEPGIATNSSPKTCIGRIYVEPRYCDFSVKISYISCGDAHTAFIAEGYIYTMGDNIDGRLGIGKREVKYVTAPCLVQSLAKYV
jgi:Alpha-tubulin suppressor and related RCC1 domain-containing proteins